MKILAYRYTPGSLGSGSSTDNGAVVTEEFRLTKSRDRRLGELRADERIQWAHACPDSTSSPLSSYAYGRRGKA